MQSNEWTITVLVPGNPTSQISYKAVSADPVVRVESGALHLCYLEPGKKFDTIRCWAPGQWIGIKVIPR